MFSRLTSVFWRRRKGVDSDSDRQQDSAAGVHLSQSSRRKRSFDEIDRSYSELTLEDADDGSTPTPDSAGRRAKRLRRDDGLADDSDDDSDDGGESEQSMSVDDSAGSSSISAAQSNRTGPTRRFIAPPPAISKPNKDGRSQKPPTIKLTPSPQQYHRMIGGGSSSGGGGGHRRLDDAQSTASQQTAGSTTASPHHHRLDANELFEAERARRRAEAASLGPGSGSGITSPAEHELFTHLYMRGYDPLIPNNWMLDFRTLPLALFGDDDDNTRADGEEKPLIHAMQGSEFRATKALRELFDTGRNLRGMVQSWTFSQNPRPSPYPPRLELVLRKTIENYMLWSLKDAGLPINKKKKKKKKKPNPLFPPSLPVHRIVTRKPNQKTADLVNELETSLHALAQRHRESKATAATATATTDNDDNDDQCSTVLPSIEIDDHIQSSSPPLLPTLFGILLTHTIVYIFTFNPNLATTIHATEEESSSSSSLLLLSNTGSSSNDNEKEKETSADLSMRYVAKFDFSDSTMDVWNAFSVAIVCIIIRKVLLEEQRQQQQQQNPQEAEMLQQHPLVEESEESEESE